MFSVVGRCVVVIVLVSCLFLFFLGFILLRTYIMPTFAVDEVEGVHCFMRSLAHNLFFVCRVSVEEKQCC